MQQFVAEAGRILSEEQPANMVLLRGWAQLPNLPDFGGVYHLNPAAIAAYPMYRGLASVANMKIIPTGMTFGDEVDTLHANWDDHDFFFIHYKPADAAGEDGDFDGKVKCLEQLDVHLPRILELNPDVLMVAGDHATPAIMAAHSWHPVPFMLHSKLTLGEGVDGFSERACAQGSLGRIPAETIMLLALSTPASSANTARSNRQRTLRNTNAQHSQHSRRQLENEHRPCVRCRLGVGNR